MRHVLSGLGILCGATLVFVGLLHGVLFARGRHDPETLGSFHDWPVIGGFFPKHVPLEKPPTPEERREKNAAAWLADARNEFKPPAPFSAEQIETLVRELKDARAQADAARARHDAEAADLDRATRELQSNQQALTQTAETLEREAKNLAASRDELDRYRTFVREQEIKNFKTLAAMYESMPPEDAAQKLQSLDDEVTAKVIHGMSERKAGKVLGAMDTPRAVAITKKLQAMGPEKPLASPAKAR
jgi:flagellar motility protein MotE (MotC chaperone)